MSLRRTNPACCSSFGIYGAKCMPREAYQLEMELYALSRLAFADNVQSVFI
jgi:hypothetical protein